MLGKEIIQTSYQLKKTYLLDLIKKTGLILSSPFSSEPGHFSYLILRMRWNAFSEHNNCRSLTSTTDLHCKLSVNDIHHGLHPAHNPVTLTGSLIIPLFKSIFCSSVVMFLMIGCWKRMDMVRILFVLGLVRPRCIPYFLECIISNSKRYGQEN